MKHPNIALLCPSVCFLFTYRFIMSFYLFHYFIFPFPILPFLMVVIRSDPLVSNTFTSVETNFTLKMMFTIQQTLYKTLPINIVNHE